MTVPPFSSAVKPAIRSRGQSDRFSSVRFLTLPPRDSFRAGEGPEASCGSGQSRRTCPHIRHKSNQSKRKMYMYMATYWSEQNKRPPRYQSFGRIQKREVPPNLADGA